MLPFAVANAVFDEYPGGVPVGSAGIESPGVLPGEVEVDEDVAFKVIFIGEAEVADGDVVGQEGQGQGCQEEGKQGVAHIVGVVELCICFGGGRCVAQEARFF